MDRPRRSPSGFRPTDTVALSTAQRMGLYQQARQYGLRIAAVGFLSLAAGGVFAGLLLHGSAGAAADRVICMFLAVGLGSSGMSLLWMRRHSWPVLAGLWMLALLLVLAGVLFRI